MSITVHCILGVDPGLSGAVAFYFPADPIHIGAEDMPTAAGEVDAAARALALRFWPGSSHFSRKKDDGRAEAALLARFAAETILTEADR